MNERLKQFIQQHWQPKPIDPPKPDPQVEHLTGPQRSAEVMRYSILSLEFWLSPLGRLREWARPLRYSTISSKRNSGFSNTGQRCRSRSFRRCPAGDPSIDYSNDRN